MTKCKSCGAASQDGKFCEECGDPRKEISKTPGLVHVYGKHLAVAGFVFLAVLAVAVVLNQGSSSSSASAEISTTGAQLTAQVAIKPPPAASAPSNTRTLVASIQGMTCGGCVAGIEKKVGALEGVISVDVYLREKSGDTVYDPSVIDKQKILDTITKYGYPATEVSDTPSGEAPKKVAVPTSAQPSSGSSGGTCGGGGGGGCGCGG